MSDKDGRIAKNTFFEGILVEFSTEGIPITEEVKSRPRLGGPSPEVLEERAREAKRFLAELEREARSDESNSGSDAGK
jgi:hypothetical protein